MNPVRPASLPSVAPGGQIQRPADPARLAAQRAFFEAALGKAPAEAAANSVPLQRRPDLAADKPAKILRPGSVLDIRV